MGNYHISVTVRLDVDRQQTNETAFDPKSRVERSVRTVKQSGSTEDGAAKPAVGVEANLPREEGAQADGDKRRTREDRQEELTNYELNSKTTQTVREGYRVQRLAIAVVVNRKQIAAQLGPTADATAINARLVELKRLVAAATGAVPDRDDSIEVSAADFGTAANDLPPADAGFTDHLLLHLGTLINGVALLVIVMVVVWFGLRPLTRVLGRTDAAVPPSLPGLTAPPETVAPAPQLTLALASPAAPVPAGATACRTDPMKTPDGAARERLEDLVAQNDVKVAKILKTWMADGTRP